MRLGELFAALKPKGVGVLDGFATPIAAARRLGKPIGICGQAPSDYPEFAEWLVSESIDSISLKPDVAIATAIRVAAVETAARSGAVG